jgi:hypothetical protein
MALADASVETGRGTVHVATAVPVSGAGLQVQTPRWRLLTASLPYLSRLMAVDAFFPFIFKLYAVNEITIRFHLSGRSISHVTVFSLITNKHLPVHQPNFRHNK